MNTAKKYFQKQLSVPEFKQSYMEEKVKLDIEYQLEERNGYNIFIEQGKSK